MERTRSGTLSVIGVAGVLLGAAALSFLFYRLVGFPGNIPLAFGSAVLLAEVIEINVTHGSAGLTRWTFTKAVFHGILTAAACWLGVWIVESLGWIG